MENLEEKIALLEQAVSDERKRLSSDRLDISFGEMIKLYKNDELIIANCDQIMNWNAYDVISEMRTYDGAVVTITDNDPKHSYVKTQDGFAIHFAEKEVISKHALTGIHYWKHSKYFFSSAKHMINDGKKHKKLHL